MKNICYKDNLSNESAKLDEHGLLKKCANENFALDFIPIYPIFEGFFADPPNNVGILIEALNAQSFPIPIEFFSCLINLFDIKPYESIHLLNIIVGMPLNFWVDNFIVKANEMIPILLKILTQIPETAIIFTSLLRISSNLVKFYLDFNIAEGIFSLFNFAESSLIALSFFRYFTRYGIAYLIQYGYYYLYIGELACRSNDPIQTQCAHVFYHYIKGHSQFNEKIKNKDQYLSDFFSLIKTFLSLSNVSKDFFIYTLKIIRIRTRSEHFYNFIVDLNFFPLVIPYFQTEHNDLTLISLNIIYNFLLEEGKKAFSYISNFSFFANLLQNFQMYDFKIQEEIMYIFIEFTTYETTDNLITLLETLPFDRIFLDFLPSSDWELSRDLFKSFVNILLVFKERERYDLIERYFFDKEFMDLLASLSEKDNSGHYHRFCRKIQELSLDLFQNANPL